MLNLMQHPGQYEPTISKQPATYIMASDRNGTLYARVTSDLIGRIHQHREGHGNGFTSRHAVKRIVWFEVDETMDSAIRREKEIKNERREWKLALIEEANPRWRGLAEELGFAPLKQP